MRIQYNQGLFTQNRYNHTNTELNKTLNKLSSGYKINTAADDAAGLAISEKMRGQVRGLHQAGENISNGLSFLQTADGGLGNISSPNLQRMRELAIQAATDTLTEDDRLKIQMEIDEIKNGIDDIANGTEFNTIKILRPSIETPQSTPSGLVDIVLIFDDTGSMSSIQNDFANNVQNLISSIQGNGVNDIRIGILNYSDSSYDKSDFNGSLWTNNTAEVISEIQTIAQSNRGGTENNMTAIEEVLNHYQFREFPNSTTNYKHIILITDEPGDDNDRASSVANRLKDENVTLHGVFNSSPEINQVVDSTGGQKVQLSGNSNWGNDLSTNIGEAIGSPSGPIIEEDSMYPLFFQVGANEGQSISCNLYDCRTHKLGIQGISVRTREEAEQALGFIDAAIQKVSEYRGEYGAIYNRLEHAYNNVKNTEENLTKAESLLRDADIAKETMKLTKDQVLLQASQSMMAQINQMSQGILQLLQ